MTTVLHIITGLNAGGAERMLAQVAAGLRDPEAPRQVVVSLMDEGVHGQALIDAGVAVHCLRMKRGSLSLTGLVTLVRLLRSLSPDVIMTWLYHADLVGCLVRPFFRSGKVVWNIRCSHMDFSRHAASTGLAVKALARLSRFVPAIVVTNSEAGRIAHEALGYRPGCWSFLPNGFDLGLWRPNPADRIAVRAELGIAEGEIAVVMVARVDPQKGHDTFLGAVSMVVRARPGVRVVLIGRNTDSLALPEVVKDRAVVLGERGDVPRLMRGMDILVMSSSYGEGFPNVVGEAMASGIPCVVSDVGDAARIVAETGLVVPTKNPSALAAALMKLMAEPEADRVARGAAARRRIAENWPADKVVQRYADLWRDILTT